MPNTNEHSQVNPLLSRVHLPGETFALPSGGVFYTPGVELDSEVENAEVHVSPMTALDEIVMKTPDKLFSGDAVREIFARCIPQVKDVNRVLAKDIDFLLICLRKVSYGDEYQIEFKHDCKDAKMHSYVISVVDFIRRAKKIDPTSTNALFGCTMSNDQRVLLQPIRYDDFIKVLQANDLSEKEQNPEKIHNILIDSTSNVIKSVDEVDDPEMIREWLRQVPPPFISKINESVDKTLQWGPDFTSEVECKDCGKPMEVTAALNPLTFFT